jgi:hypothetical protein
MKIPFNNKVLLLPMALFQIALLKKFVDFIRIDERFFSIEKLADMDNE